jgi:hypothetical protein
VSAEPCFPELQTKKKTNTPKNTKKTLLTTNEDPPKKAMLVFVVHCSPEKLNQNLPISFSSAKDVILTIDKKKFVSLFFCE